MSDPPFFNPSSVFSPEEMKEIISSERPDAFYLRDEFSKVRSFWKITRPEDEALHNEIDRLCTIIESLDKKHDELCLDRFMLMAMLGHTQRGSLLPDEFYKSMSVFQFLQFLKGMHSSNQEWYKRLSDSPQPSSPENHDIQK